MRRNLSNFQIDLDKFINPRRIGGGTFGEVYLVENVDDGRTYALKKLYPKKDMDNQKYFNREINIMIRLNHPSIVKFYGYALMPEVGGVSILMEHAQNGSLRSILEKLKEEPVPGYDNTTKQKILVGVARGMMHIHNNHLIHRDIKPENILLDGNFNPLITDFGLSRSSDNEIGYTENAGSPIYRAPEVYESKEYDQSIDVYSFGIMMYEIVTSLLPYYDFLPTIKGAFNFMKAVKELNRRPTFPEDQEISQEMKDLIESCWSANPSDRPTFEQIFNKLAYDCEDPSNFTDLFDEENEHMYYLPGVKQEDILDFTDELIERENTEIYSIKQSIANIKQQVSSIKQDSELVFDQIKAGFDELRKEVLDRLDNGKKQDTDISLKYSTKIYEYKDGKDFEGIFRNLTRLTGSNIHDNKTIKITTNSQHSDDIHFFFKSKNIYDPKNIVDFDKDNEYKSNDSGKAIICIDFKDKLVKVTQYQIQTSMKNNSSSHLKNWSVDGSKDGFAWFELDKRKNVSSLNQPKSIAVFEVHSQTNEFYRYIRIRQTGTSWYNTDNCNIISICRLDFFGQVMEPSK